MWRLWGSRRATDALRVAATDPRGLRCDAGGDEAGLAAYGWAGTSIPGVVAMWDAT